jgi:hypothetical protein
MNSSLISAIIVSVVLQRQLILVRCSESQFELEIISLAVQKTSPTGALSRVSNCALWW